MPRLRTCVVSVSAIPISPIAAIALIAPAFFRNVLRSCPTANLHVAGHSLVQSRVGIIRPPGRKHERKSRWERFVQPGRKALGRGQFHDHAVTPAVLGLRKLLHGAIQVRIGARINDASTTFEAASSHPKRDYRVSHDVLYPVGALAMFRDDVVAAVVFGEPDLDFARHTTVPASGRKVKKKSFAVACAHCCLSLSLSLFSSIKFLSSSAAPRSRIHCS